MPQQSNQGNVLQFEHIMVSVKANSIDKPLVVYPQNNTKTNITATGFFEEFSTFIEELLAFTDQRLLIVGDFNFHVDSIESFC